MDYLKHLRVVGAYPNAITGSMGKLNLSQETGKVHMPIAGWQLH